MLNKQMLLFWNNLFALLFLVTTVIFGMCLDAAHEYAHTLQITAMQFDSVVFYGITIEHWTLLHITSVMIFGATIILHLVLNFPWIKNAVLKFKQKNA